MWRLSRRNKQLSKRFVKCLTNIEIFSILNSPFLARKEIKEKEMFSGLRF